MKALSIFRDTTLETALNRRLRVFKTVSYSLWSLEDFKRINCDKEIELAGVSDNRRSCYYQPISIECLTSDTKNEESSKHQYCTVHFGTVIPRPK